MLIQLGPSTVLATDEGCARSGWVIDVPEPKGNQLIADGMAKRCTSHVEPRVVFKKGGPNIRPAKNEQPEPAGKKG